MRSRALALLLLGSVLTALLAAAGVSWAGGGLAFPASVYPAPVAAAPNHGLTLCPSPAGLQAFTRATASAARRAAAAVPRHEPRHRLAQLRPGLVAARAAALGIGAAKDAHVVLGSGPAARSELAVFMRPACGPSTLSKSLLVTVGPRQPAGPKCVACNAHLFFVSRAGRALLYYTY